MNDTFRLCFALQTDRWRHPLGEKEAEGKKKEKGKERGRREIRASKRPRYTQFKSKTNAYPAFLNLSTQAPAQKERKRSNLFI